jgi:hypothetical protein
VNSKAGDIQIMSFNDAPSVTIQDDFCFTTINCHDIEYVTTCKTCAKITELNTESLT